MTDQRPAADPAKTLFDGVHVRLVQAQGWEYVERKQLSGIVAMVAVTNDARIILVEQYRIPVGRKVIELPAGLAGDDPRGRHENLEAAARRELLEETGYAATEMMPLTMGPPSAGISSEVVTLFQATGLRRVAPGGGAGDEAIVVHEVPVAEAESWLAGKLREGVLIDPKVYAGLHFAPGRPPKH